MYAQELLNALLIFYQKVEKRTSRLEEKHVARLQCQKGCHSCCLDDLEVVGIEAAFIQQQHPELLFPQLAHPLGKCAFLNDEGACRVYESRPLVCRTHGFPLQWTEIEHRTSVEYRDICPLNENEEPIEQLEEEDCLKIDQLEETLARLQLMADQGAMHRIKLRDLFKTKPDNAH